MAGCRNCNNRAGNHARQSVAPGSASPWLSMPLVSTQTDGIDVEYVGKRHGTMTYKVNGRSYQAGNNSAHSILRGIPKTDANMLVVRYTGEFRILNSAGEQAHGNPATHNAGQSYYEPSNRAAAPVVAEYDPDEVDSNDVPLLTSVAAPVSLPDVTAFDVPVAEGLGEVAAPAEADPEAPVSNTDFTSIRGVSARHSRLLNSSGITTFQVLGAADPQGIGLLLNISEPKATEIVNGAKALL